MRQSRCSEKFRFLSKSFWSVKNIVFFYKCHAKMLKKKSSMYFLFKVSNDLRYRRFENLFEKQETLCTGQQSIDTLLQYIAVTDISTPTCFLTVRVTGLSAYNVKLHTYHKDLPLHFYLLLSTNHCNTIIVDF